MAGALLTGADPAAGNVEGVVKWVRYVVPELSLAPRYALVEGYDNYPFPASAIRATIDYGHWVSWATAGAMGQTSSVEEAREQVARTLGVEPAPLVDSQDPETLRCLRQYGW